MPAANGMPCRRPTCRSRQGVSAGNRLDYFYDVFGDLGGRILKNKWWFYGGWHAQKKNPTVIGYLGKDGEQGFDPLLQTNQEVKSTFQATRRTSA